MHDFEHFNKITSSYNNNLIPAKEIKNRKIYGKYTPLIAENINKIFSENKNLILVTDKITNYSILLENFKFKDRIITEVFSIEQYKQALKQGILYPALCCGNIAHLKKVLKHNIKFITTDITFFKNNINIFKYFHKKGVVIMVYGTPSINDMDFLKDNLGKTCSLAYVDTVVPFQEQTK